MVLAPRILRERPVERWWIRSSRRHTLQRELLLDEAWRRGWKRNWPKNHRPCGMRYFREVRVEQLQELATLLVEQPAQLAAAPWPARQPLESGRCSGKLAASGRGAETLFETLRGDEESYYHEPGRFSGTLPLGACLRRRIVAVLPRLN